VEAMNQQNTAMVEQLAAAARSLQDHVIEVSSSMRLFRLSPREATMAQPNAVEMRCKSKML